MPETIHYYFTPVSPFTYLAGDRLETGAAGIPIAYHPVDLAEVFAATGGVPLGERSRQRLEYRLQELRRISAAQGMAINFHPKHFPVDAKPACRLCLAVRDGGDDVGVLARALLAAVWREERDVSDEAVLADILSSLGLARGYLETSRGLDEQLGRESRAAIEAGVFGSPFYIVGDERFWGQDRLEQALAWARRS